MTAETTKITTKINSKTKPKPKASASLTGTTRGIGWTVNTTWINHQHVTEGMIICIHAHKSLYKENFGLDIVLITMLFFPNGNIPLPEAAVSNATQVTTSTDASVPTTLSQGIFFH